MATFFSEPRREGMQGREARSEDVLVAGLGTVSALGMGVEALWESLLSGASALRPSPSSPRGLPVPAHAGTLGEAAREIEEWVDAKYLRRLSNLSRFALGAASLCMKKAPAFRKGSLAGREGPGGVTAVVLGTSYGSSAYHFEYYERLFRNGPKDASPILFSESVMNSSSGHVSIYFGLRGASLALVGGEEVGLSAVVDAADRIRLGEERAALAGGAEEYCDFVHAALGERGIVSDERGDPFSGGERGSFLGEGAAFLLLEDEASLFSGGSALVRVAGAGMSRARRCEGRSAKGQAADAVARAISQALLQAKVEPSSVDLVVTSASGRMIDREEAEGISRALRPGSGKNEIFLLAPKRALGEGFGFTSAVEALLAVKALEEGVVPPTPGAFRALLPPGLHLPREPLEAALERALAVSLSSLGYAVAVLFEKIKR